MLRNYINEITPSEIRATVLSVRSLAIRLSFVFVGPVIGWQADVSGVPCTLYVSGGFFLLAGAWAAQMLVREQKGKDNLPHLKDVRV